ncbi:MAG: beta-propeller fold lactonase family protein [Chitinophagaceae bacterium]
MKVLPVVAIAAILMAGCHKHDGDGQPAAQGHLIYLETNDAAGNAVLAYVQKADSTIEALPGSPFATGGKGLNNPTQGLGPDDADNEVVITQDNKFLLAVNAGSRSIAVFRIGTDGSLTAVSGSPFNSGGPNPESIAVSGQYVYVVNKGTNDPETSGNEPNYTIMKMDANGTLTPVDNSTIKAISGSSPSQALLSNDRHFLFGSDFLGFMLTPVQGSLRSFTIGSDHKLTVASAPIVIPGKGGALGLWQHPSANILYVGFPLQGKVAVYNIDVSTGALNFSKTVDAGPAACWLRTSKDGKYLYALNSGENTISIFNTSDPGSPSALGKFTLKNSGPIYMAMGLSFTTSEDFSFEFSRDGKYCYVVCQYTNADFTLGSYNLLHVLVVGADGLLSEPGNPVQLPVNSTVRPQGVVTL